jgi:putative transposase
MTTVSCDVPVGNGGFDSLVRSFLGQSGLPFADVLSAQAIEQAFSRRGALFAGDDVFSTPIVLWAFLAQVLRDGKGSACAAAVADIATYLQQGGRPGPCGDTGDYCRARAKLDLGALRDLVRQSADGLRKEAREDWLWHGRHAKLVDGFTFTMPDTPDNQQAYPQSRSQAPGVGLPIARACAVLSLATAAIHDLAIGPCKGKETGETALLRGILDSFAPGDVAVFDRYYCSYWMVALLQALGVDICTRLHQCRREDFSQGKPLGPNDRLVTWMRPSRPDWMSDEVYQQMPQTLTLRMLRFNVSQPGRRAQTITVVTTLLDPVEYPAEDLAELYGYRWNVELDIRQIKQTLGLDHARCKTPQMVQRQLWVTLLAYNLIRSVIASAATTHGKQPRQLGFTLACQCILSSWMLLATGLCGNVSGLAASTLARIAANEVAHRPGRTEPRVLKRRRHRYPLMQISRLALKMQLTKGQPS